MWFTTPILIYISVILWRASRYWSASTPTSRPLENSLSILLYQSWYILLCHAPVGLFCSADSKCHRWCRTSRLVLPYYCHPSKANTSVETHKHSCHELRSQVSVPTTISNIWFDWPFFQIWFRLLEFKTLNDRICLDPILRPNHVDLAEVRCRRRHWSTGASSLKC